jgi:hypothetical protein
MRRPIPVLTVLAAALLCGCAADAPTLPPPDAPPSHEAACAAPAVVMLEDGSVAYRCPPLIGSGG